MTDGPLGSEAHLINQEARQQSDRNKATHKAAIQGVADRNEAAHREAKKRMAIKDAQRAELFKSGEH